MSEDSPQTRPDMQMLRVIVEMHALAPSQIYFLPSSDRPLFVQPANSGHLGGVLVCPYLGNRVFLTARMPRHRHVGALPGLPVG